MTALVKRPDAVPWLVIVVMPLGRRLGRELTRAFRRSHAETVLQAPLDLNLPFLAISALRGLALARAENEEALVSGGFSNGRTWDRTRDLPRVKRALSR